MTDDSADSVLSLLDFSPDVCAAQTCLSPPVEDGKTQKY